MWLRALSYAIWFTCIQQAHILFYIGIFVPFSIISTFHSWILNLEDRYWKTIFIAAETEAPKDIGYPHLPANSQSTCDLLHKCTDALQQSSWAYHVAGFWHSLKRYCIIIKIVIPLMCGVHTQSSLYFDGLYVPFGKFISFGGACVHHCYNKCEKRR